MRNRLVWIRRAYLLGSGGVTCSLVTALGDVNFAQLLADFLSLIVSAIVSLLLGGDPTRGPQFFF